MAGQVAGQVAGHRVTLADVASDAGVSRSTVSLVVQGSSLVAEPTRRRVSESMERLGYVYHRGAASLRRQRSSTVGLTITSIANPFFADLMLGIESELAPLGYVVLLSNTFDSLERERASIQALLEHRAAGLLMVPSLDAEAATFDRLRAAGMPYVLMTRYLDDLRAPYIGPDDVFGGRLAARHLLDHGCRDIVYLGGPEAGTARRDRLRGFLGVLDEHGYAVDRSRMWGSHTDSAAGYELGRRLLAEEELPDGVVCHSDAIAFGLLRSLRDAGAYDVGRCRVIGFDDVEYARSWDPPLTSVSVAPVDMGRRAARMFLERTTEPTAPSASVVLEPTLSVRGSCGCVA